MIAVAFALIHCDGLAERVCSGLHTLSGQPARIDPLAHLLSLLVTSTAAAGHRARQREAKVRIGRVNEQRLYQHYPYDL